MKKPLIYMLTAAVAFVPNVVWALGVKDVETYLNNLSTYAAEFQQLDSYGNYASGQFYLNRPYQLLWEYEQPNDQKIISTGTKLYFHDGNTGQVTQLPRNSGIPSLLITKTISLVDNAYFHQPEIAEEDGWAVMTLRSKKADALNTTPDTLEFVFTTEPMQLKRMTTISEMGEKVIVTFSQIQEGVALDKDLFEFDYQEPFADF